MFRALGDGARKAASPLQRALTASAARHPTTTTRHGGSIVVVQLASTPTASSASSAAAAARAAHATRGRHRVRPLAADVVEVEMPLIANMIVERIPFLLPLPPAWETEYNEWSHERAQRWRKELPREITNPKKEYESEDELRQMEAFVAAPRETDADRANDVRSMRRKSDQFLFLVVQDADTGVWGFPRRKHSGKEGETMRQVATAAMEACIGDSIETYVVGNAPMGKFPEKAAAAKRETAKRETAAAEGDGGGDGGGGGDGAAAAPATTGGGVGTNYYHRAQWIEGVLKLESKCKDYKWLTKVRARSSVAPRRARRLFFFFPAQPACVFVARSGRSVAFVGLVRR
jgi:large subunit ribosomal protein L46